MLRGMTSEQLNEWMAFYSLEPFGFLADLFGHAITSTVVHNMMRGKGKPLKPEDFLPKEKEQHEATAEEFIVNLKRFFGK